MTRTLSPRERRLVAVLILLALVALVVQALVLPVADGFSARAATRAQGQADYARNARLIASAPRLARLAERQKRDLAAFIIVAPTPAAAGEMVQERLQDAIEASGGEFRAGDIRSPDADRVGASVEARLTQAQLLKVLESLEGQPPWLAISAVTISASDVLTTVTPGPMDVRIDVAIPYRPGA